MVQQLEATRIGSTYSVSGNNITAGTMGGLTKASGDSAATAAASQTQGSYSVTTAGSAFSLTESFVMGDAVNPIGTGVDVSAGIVSDMPAYGSVTTQSGGVAGSLAGTITSAGVMTLTSWQKQVLQPTSQFVSEIAWISMSNEESTCDCCGCVCPCECEDCECCACGAELPTGQHDL